MDRDFLPDRCCSEDYGGSHYHCACGAVSGVQGCGDKLCGTCHGKFPCGTHSCPVPALRKLLGNLEGFKPAAAIDAAMALFDRARKAVEDNKKLNERLHRAEQILCSIQMLGGMRPELLRMVHEYYGASPSETPSSTEDTEPGRRRGPVEP